MFGRAGRSFGYFLGLVHLTAATVLWSAPARCVEVTIYEGKAVKAERLAKELADRIRRGVWEWDPAGRRDPFIFRQPKQEVRRRTRIQTGPIEVGLPPQPGPGKGTPATGTQADVTKQRLEVKKVAEELAARAFEALGRQEYVKVEEFVAGALNRMRTVELQDPESRKVEEKLVRLYNAAGRLKKRAEIETQFRNLKIVIKGIVWQAVNSVAVINDTVVEEGDVVLGARVEEIRPGEVIFNLKGVRVSRSP